ncbi:MAG: phosphoribosyl-AMP cyclohydrolase [Alicyclobacillus sp.]|nr:phosphoribosyl-AMP cyclohydrolase [Alicyclobacillus sp.]
MPSESVQEALLEEVRYDPQTGLVPVIVQDAHSGQVLTLAYANREALKRTFGTGYAWFWSRSRQSYWQKGETSGHVQRVTDIRLDCDGDAVLYRVEPAGPACHTGASTCFFRRLTYPGGTPTSAVGSRAAAATQPAGGVSARVVSAEGATEATAQRRAAAEGQPQTAGTTRAGRDLAHAAEGEQASEGINVLQRLWSLIDQRRREMPPGSYTTYLFTHGIDKVAKKLGEESVEVVIAAKNAAAGEAGKAALVEESADLLYHLWVLWRAAGVQPSEVFTALQRRDRSASNPGPGQG